MLRSRHQHANGRSQQQPLLNGAQNRPQNGPQRLRSLWFQLFFGCTFLSVGVWILLWSEGRLLKRTLSLHEGLQTIIPIQNSEVVDPENEGALIHLIGHLEVGEPLTEFEYGVSVPAVKLKRRVQMFQWVEYQANNEVVMDDVVFPQDPSMPEFNYYYETEWRDKLIDSNLFQVTSGHENPKRFPIRTTLYESTHVSVGGFLLGQALKDLFTEHTLVTSDDRPERRDIKLHAGLYYHSHDVWNPEVGDIRLQFSYCGLAGDIVTLVGRQVGHEVQPYATQHGETLLLLRHGRYSISQLFHEKHNENWLLTWVTRSSCGVLLYIGAAFVSGMLKQLTTAPGSYMSRFSTLREYLSDNFKSVNVSVALTISFTILSLTWFSHRPVMSSCLAIIATLPALIVLFNLLVPPGEEPGYRQL